MAKKKQADDEKDDDKLEAEDVEKKERPEAEDIELDLGDEEPAKEAPAAAAADAEEDDDEPATRKARRDKRKADVVAEEKERSARLEAEIAELRRQVQASQQQYRPAPQQQAEGPDELDTLRWHAQMAARAAQDDRLPEAERTRAAREFDRIKAMHDRAYMQRNAPQAPDVNSIRDSMTREFLVAEDPEAFSDPVIAEACKAEVDRLTKDPRIAALPPLAIGRMAIKSARAKLGRPAGGSAPPDAAAQAKLGASTGRGQAAPAKRTVKIPRHIVGIARDTFPNAKNDEEAVRKWAERAKKANPELIKELGL